MHRFGRWIIVGTLAVGGLAGAHEHAKGQGTEKTSLSEVPASVRSTFEKEANGGQIEELRRDTRNGKTVFNGEVVKDGKGTDLCVGSDGKIIDKSKAHDEAGEHEK